MVKEGSHTARMLMKADEATEAPSTIIQGVKAKMDEEGRPYFSDPKAHRMTRRNIIERVYFQ